MEPLSCWPLVLWSLCNRAGIRVLEWRPRMTQQRSCVLQLSPDAAKYKHVKNKVLKFPTMVAESGVALPLLITELSPASAFSTFGICPPIMDQRVTANKWPSWSFSLRSCQGLGTLKDPRNQVGSFTFVSVSNTENPEREGIIFDSFWVQHSVIQAFFTVTLLW